MPHSGRRRTMIDLSPREKRQQRTHQAILDAARHLINEKGVDGLSMRAIAERIDYSPAGLYEYFGSKEEIIGALCQQGHRRLTAYMAAVDQNLLFRAYFLEIGLAYVQFAVQNPDFFLLMFTHHTTGAGDLIALEQWLASDAMQADSSFVILVDAIKRGVAEGILRIRPEMGVIEMAFAAWATVHGIAMLRITHLRSLQADFDTLTRETLLAFGKGLALRGSGVA
jgi:AcrR family transcriptional regulator